MQTTTVTQTVTPATRDDVIKLKEDWMRDPCFDLDGIPGFEAYDEELRAFQTAQEQQWKATYEAKRAARIGKLAVQLGCADNLQLAAYVDGLNSQLDALRERIETLEDRPR
jgi:hypothetical protein